MYSLTNSDLQRFWSKVNKLSEDECWLWTGASSNGYGYMKILDKPCLVHRISLHIFNGSPISNNGSRRSGLNLHSCNNSLCVNPKHLYTGTQRNNVEDSVVSGSRYIRRSKFSLENMNEMRRLRNEESYTLQQIGDKFGVTKQMIRLILKGDIRSKSNNYPVFVEVKPNI